MRGRKADPQTVSLIMVYTLSKALAISPLEVYKMPLSLAKDLLTVHGITEKIKHEEIEKVRKQVK
jgi:hypothetical protein|tara:strand:- start:3877 stop:4071 length:195 start_codon:yes stop_codon:yes gene_type:complete